MKLTLTNTRLFFFDYKKEDLEDLIEKTALDTLKVEKGQTREDARQKQIFNIAFNRHRYDTKKRETAMKTIDKWYTGYQPLIKKTKKQKGKPQLWYCGIGLLPEILELLNEKEIQVHLDDRRKNIPTFSMDNFKTIDSLSGNSMQMRTSQVDMFTKSQRLLEVKNCTYSGEQNENGQFVYFGEVENKTFLYLPLGVMDCAVGTGKTPAMMSMAQQKLTSGKTIMLVKSGALFNQHIVGFQDIFENVGWIGQKSNKKEGFKNGDVIIAKVDSIPVYLLGTDDTSKQVQDLLKYDCDLLLADEVEEFMSENKSSKQTKGWQGGRKAVVESINASGRYGFSGTIKNISEQKRRYINTSFADVLHEVTNGENVDNGYTLRTDVLVLECPESGINPKDYKKILDDKITLKQGVLNQLIQDNSASNDEIKVLEKEIEGLVNANKKPHLREEYFEVQTNENRNKLVAEIVEYVESIGLSSLLYLRKTQFHLPEVQKKLAEVGSYPVLLTGQQTSEEITSNLACINDRKVLTCIGTQTVQRGINMPTVQVLLYLPYGSSESEIEQVSGRPKRLDRTKEHTVFEAFRRENPSYEWDGEGLFFKSFLYIEFAGKGKYEADHAKKRLEFWKKNTGCTISFGKGVEAVKNYMRNRVD